MAMSRVMYSAVKSPVMIHSIIPSSDSVITGLFSVRVLVENVKESQGGGLEDTLGLLSTGQWLSIPFIVIGISLMLYSRRKGA